MSLATLFVDSGPVMTDLIGLSAVPLGPRHVPDAAVAVLMVLLDYDCHDPGAGHLHGWEVAHWVARRYFTVRNSDSKNGFSFLPLGLEKELSNPSSSSRLSSVATRMDLPLSTWRISDWVRLQLICSRRQARPTRSAAT